MRKPILILAGLVVVAGGAFAVRAWQRERVRARELDSMLERAQSLARSEAGLSDANVELERALALAPDDVRALRLGGDVSFRLRRYDAAVERIRRASELADESQRPALQLELGRAATEKYRGTNREDDFRTARNALQSAMTDPGVRADAMYAYGILFLENGRFRDVDKALGVLEELLAKHPDHVEADRVRGLVEALRGGA